MLEVAFASWDLSFSPLKIRRSAKRNTSAALCNLYGFATFYLVKALQRVGFSFSLLKKFISYLRNIFVSSLPYIC